MKELLKNLMNLDKPILTKDLAPKLAPFARIIYIVALVIYFVAAITDSLDGKIARKQKAMSRKTAISAYL